MTRVHDAVELAWELLRVDLEAASQAVLGLAVALVCSDLVPWQLVLPWHLVQLSGQLPVGAGRAVYSRWLRPIELAMTGQRKIATV